MSSNELINKIEALNEWEQMIEDAKQHADELREAIKEEMALRDTEELIVGNYIVRWTSILSNRFDTTSFKKKYGEIYKHFTKQVSSRRFTISC